jgi:phosphoglycolate phosphatase
LDTLAIDLDGTLLDTLVDLTNGLAPILATRGLPLLTATDVRPLIGDGLAALLERALAHYGQAPHPGDYSAFAQAYEHVSGTDTRPYEGALAALDHAAANGWQLAICTNKAEAAARHLLDRLGLSSRFAAVCGGDTFSVSKPDPGHLLGTIERAGGTADRSVAIGDLRHDLLAARAGGVPAIWAEWGYGTTETRTLADATATSWKDVSSIARRLLP